MRVLVVDVLDILLQLGDVELTVLNFSWKSASFEAKPNKI